MLLSSSPMYQSLVYRALTDILGLFSSMMFSNVHACALGDAAGDVSATSTTISWKNSIVISLLISIGEKKWLSEKKESFCNSKHIFLSDRSYIGG